MKKILTLLLSLTLVFAAGCSSSGSSIRFGSAAVGGVYSSFANAFTQVVSQETEDYEFTVKSTAGSAANLRLLSDNYIQMAIAQADLTADACAGKGQFEGDPQTDYRAIAALYTEACQIIVRADSDIQTPDDLLKKKISVGETDSGSEKNAEQILQIYGLSDNLIETVNMNYTEEAEALSSGKIDAIFCTAGTQTSMIEGLAQKCDIRLLSIDATHMEKLLAESDTYSNYTIPAGTYTGQQEDVTTIGVSALLLARTDLDDKTVEKLTGILFNHAQDISYATSLNLTLTPEQAVKNVPVPFHKGAAAYYEKQGLSVTTE